MPIRHKEGEVRQSRSRSVSGQIARPNQAREQVGRTSRTSSMIKDMNQPLRQSVVLSGLPGRPGSAP
jgi:hypothetical protein